MDLDTYILHIFYTYFLIRNVNLFLNWAHTALIREFIPEFIPNMTTDLLYSNDRAVGCSGQRTNKLGNKLSVRPALRGQKIEHIS